MRIYSLDAPILLPAVTPASRRTETTASTAAPTRATLGPDLVVLGSGGPQRAGAFPLLGTDEPKVDPTDVEVTASEDGVTAKGGFVSALLDLAGSGLTFLKKLSRFLPF